MPLYKREKITMKEEKMTTREIAKENLGRTPTNTEVKIFSDFLGYLEDTHRVKKAGKSKEDGRKTLWMLTDNGRWFYKTKWDGE